MGAVWKSEIALLLRQSRIGFLATVGKKALKHLLDSFAICHGNILLHLSWLARYAANIKTNPAIGLMVCTPEAADSPLALPRRGFQGEVAFVTGEQPDMARAVCLQAIPDAEPLFSFGDFQLFQLSVTSLCRVSGSGSAQTIAATTWYKEMECHHA